MVYVVEIVIRHELDVCESELKEALNTLQDMPVGLLIDGEKDLKVFESI